MLTNNLVELATDIQRLIKDYQTIYPEEKQSKVIQDYVLQALMIKSKGKSNPETLKHMISLERSVYTPNTDIMNWI